MLSAMSTPDFQLSSQPRSYLLDAVPGNLSTFLESFQRTADFLDISQGVVRNGVGVSGGGVVVEKDEDLDELLDQLDLDDTICDQSKPLTIDPEVFKINWFSNHDRTEAGVTRRARGGVSEADRASRHLSGGGILTGSPPKEVDLLSERNPFKNFMRGALEPGAGQRAPNPFRLEEVVSINCRPRSLHPELSLTIPSAPEQDHPSPTGNPFLTPAPSPIEPLQLFPQLPNNSSFIFAVPVIIHNVTSSSTQTPPHPAPEPVYQNTPSAHLRKFMDQHDPSEYDLQCLTRTIQELRTSGWYYENVSWQDSILLLKQSEPGTFLIRDSSDPRFLFSLSVQTSRGPTSVRLHYIHGLFRLDAEKRLIPHMPSFTSVIELVDYYIHFTLKNQRRSRPRRNGKTPKAKEQVWVDAQGNIYSNILLVKPLMRKEHIPSLQHLSRVLVNRTLKQRFGRNDKVCFKVTPVYDETPFMERTFPCDSDAEELNSADGIEALPIPWTLVEFIKSYPYCH